jgi:hypothetical protein
VCLRRRRVLSAVALLVRFAGLGQGGKEWCKIHRQSYSTHPIWLSRRFLPVGEATTGIVPVAWRYVWTTPPRSVDAFDPLNLLPASYGCVIGVRIVVLSATDLATMSARHRQRYEHSKRSS